jgi:hypothetical protein
MLWLISVILVLIVTIVAALELDDGTYRNEKDARRDGIFTSAKVLSCACTCATFPAWTS